ncbi:hypothetical protein ACFFWD_20140 [Bradyrhizobium erythrophlei]|uniref:hypothetical protein n=1 Tax=Bradyrhizobium erythrophlei TaxID=1437360 RepID=UPI0035EFCC64
MKLLRPTRKSNVGAAPATNQPDGQYSASVVGQISGTNPPVSRDEGRLAIVTNVVWDAVDAECATDECA